MTKEITPKLKTAEEIVYRVIKEAGDEIQATDIIIRSNLYASVVFIALRKLLALGLIEKRREGRNVYYKAIK